MADVTREQVIDFLSNMNVMDLAELVKELEEKWGVSAAAPMAMAAMPAAAGGAGAAEEEAPEQTEFTAHLKSFGSQKIQVIKVVRAITGLGLKEAKDLVDGAPSVIKESVDKEEGEKIKKQIEEVGGEVEIK